MKRRNNLNQITDAYTSKTPTEDWYLERMSICNGCEFNSANNPGEAQYTAVGKEGKDFLDKTLDFFKVPHCIACGCPVAKKAALRDAECGLSETTLPLKWRSIDVLTEGKGDWNVINMSPHKVKIYLSEKGDSFIVDYGTIDRKADTSVKLLLEGTREIGSVGKSCGCVTPTYKKRAEQTDEGYIVDVRIKTSGKFGKFSESMYVISTDKIKTRFQLIGKITG